MRFFLNLTYSSSAFQRARLELQHIKTATLVRGNVSETRILLILPALQSGVHRVCLDFLASEQPKSGNRGRPDRPSAAVSTCFVFLNGGILVYHRLKAFLWFLKKSDNFWYPKKIGVPSEVSIVSPSRLVQIQQIRGYSSSGAGFRGFRPFTGAGRTAPAPPYRLVLYF